MAYLKSVELQNFRRHNNIQLEFSPYGNILLGPNGCGKTTIVEAVSFLALTKSFRTKKDAEVKKFDAGYFRVHGVFQNEESQEEITVFYKKGETRNVFSGKKKISKIIDYIGRYPVVITTLEDIAVVSGAPVNRRRFLDRMIGQSDARYLQSLKEYQKILHNRNKLLKDVRTDVEHIMVWTEQMSPLAEEIQTSRRQAIQQLETRVASMYKESGVGAELNIRYKSTASETSTLKSFKQSLRRDIKYGFTTIGPHADDVQFFTNGQPVRTYSSQGEQKLFLLLLKIAEGSLIKDWSGKQPIHIFDDMFASLDKKKANFVLDLLGKESQKIITTTDMSSISNNKKRTKTIRIEDYLKGEIVAVA
ncbi:MAG: DNA replication/repair protein RecF [Candidatus Marinimicrobia bacterium]|nr:DNA replication/repair protein RecF [Candidatus Neomarinimicrobiota bacterium]